MTTYVSPEKLGAARNGNAYAETEHLLDGQAASLVDASRSPGGTVSSSPAKSLFSGSPVATPASKLAWHALLDEETKEETESPCLFAHSVREDSSKQQLKALLSSMIGKESARLPEDSRLNKFCRPVYLVNCATVDVTWKIRAKGQQVTSGAWSRILDMLPGAIKGMLEMQFSSRKAAIQTARSTVRDAFPRDGDDADLEVFQEMPGGDMTSALLGIYVRLAEHAEKHNAVLVVPWWCHHDTNVGAQLFLQALDMACFRGPVVTICNGPWTLLQKADARQFKFRVAGDPEVSEHRPATPVMRRASHSILVTASREGYENTATSFRVAAEVAKLLAGGSQQDVKSPVVAFMANGGRNCIYAAAQSSLIGIPLLTIQGSGKLADYLPEAWLRRGECLFDQQQEAREACRKCGFKGELTSEEGMLVRQVLHGRLVICPLSSGPVGLERALDREFDEEEEAFTNAKARYRSYAGAAIVAIKPGIVLHVLIIFAVLLIVFLVQMKSEFDLVKKFERYSPPDRTLHFIIAVQPLFLAVWLSLRKDYDFYQTAVALHHAKALIEGHLWRYASLTGVYSNTNIVKSRLAQSNKKTCFVNIVKGSNLRAADIGGKSDPYVVCKIAGKEGSEDKTGFKSRTLNPVWNEELLINRFEFGDSIEFFVMDHDYMREGDFLGHATIEGSKLTAKSAYPVSETLELSDDGKHGSEGKDVKGNITVKVNVANGDEDVASSRSQKLAAETLLISQNVDVSAWGEVAPDLQEAPGTLPPQVISSGDEYVQKRVRPQLERWRRKADNLQTRQVVLRFITYFLGAFSTILALLWHEIWVMFTVSLLVAITAWDSVLPVDDQLRRGNLVVRRLAEAEAEWHAIPQEKRSGQQVLDVLVNAVEDALLEATQRSSETHEGSQKALDWS